MRYISRIINRSRIFERKLPSNYLDKDFVFFQDHISYATNDAFVKEYHNVLVSPDSILYKNYLLQHISLAANKYKRYYQFNYLIKKVLTSKRKHYSDGDFLLVTDSWSTGHFHWFCDVLPKLWCIKEELHNYILLLPDTAYIRRMAIPSLALLKMNFKEIAFMKEGELYSIKNLHFVSKIAKSGTLDDDIMKQLAYKFRKTEEAPEKRIYISRKNARFRKILNEQDLIHTLRNFNFTIIESDNFSLSDHIELFSSGKILMSIHGAGLTNMIFMFPHARIMEFRRPGKPENHCYWHLAGALDLKYYYFFGIPDSEKPIEGQGCNLTIPIKGFEKLLVKSLVN